MAMSSLDAHGGWPGVLSTLTAGDDLDSDTARALQERGHQVEVWDEWTPRMGALCAIEIDRQRGALFAGADLRRDGYAMGR